MTWFRTYLIPKLSDSEPIRCQTYLVLNLSDSEPVWFRIYRIPNLPIWFRTYLIPNLSDSKPTYRISNLSDWEPIRLWTYLMPNLSDTESIWSWTYQILELRPVWGQLLCVAHNVPLSLQSCDDYQHLLVATKQVNPSPLSAHDNLQTRTLGCNQEPNRSTPVSSSLPSSWWPLTLPSALSGEISSFYVYFIVDK